MIVVTWIFALLAALVHVLVFVWETILFERPGVHRGIFAIPTEDVRPVRLWAFNVGFYNLFLGAGMVLGVVAWAGGAEQLGRGLIIYLSSFMVLAGIVLFVSDRLALGRPRGSGVTGAISQAAPPLLALISIMIAAQL